MLISYAVKQQMVSLAGACFWYWDSFYGFLESSGVSKSLCERFPKDNKYQVMRSVLGALEDRNDTATLKNLVSNFYRMQRPADRDKLDENRAKELLREFRELVGNDPIEAELDRRAQKQARESYERKIEGAKGRLLTIASLNERFQKLATDTSITPQVRGFRLETLFFDLLHHSEIEHTKPYRTPDGEQIDGHFRYEKFDYLVESKWESERTKQKDLSVFDGKIRGKAQSTRGFFLSASGFDDNAVAKFSGDAPRIVLMTGEDLAIVLGGRVSIVDAMRAKVDAIVRFGHIHFAVRDI